MKQIVTAKEDRYIELQWFQFTKVVVVEETPMLCKLDLLGAESPVTFKVEIIDNSKADLMMYLSTECKEPNEKKNDRAVERMATFKFTAKKKALFFGDDDVCYITLESIVGCTVRIRPSSTKIRALAEPEKVKEFNKALSKSEIDAEITA